MPQPNSRKRGIILAAIGAGVLGLGGLAAYRYRQWLQACQQRQMAESMVAETAQGAVEYAFWGTSDPVILFVHGQPGGYDQGKPLAGAAVEHGYRLLSVSRPGYLRTPLAVGRTPAEQADALAAFLAELEMDRVAVVALSGGGPAGLQFAIRHPGRCQALVLIAAVSHAKDRPANFIGWLLSTRLLTSNVAGWLLGIATERWPALLARVLVPDPEEQAAVLADPLKRAVLYGLAQTGIQLPAQRRAGNENDNDQIAALPVFPVETIQAPTLVIHGTDDVLVPYSHAQFIMEGVEGAQLDAISSGSHAIFVTHTGRVFDRLFSFLEICNT
jgi:pimeloyl-ACP methyl ester carboxylesterase